MAFFVSTLYVQRAQGVDSLRNFQNFISRLLSQAPQNITCKKFRPKFRPKFRLMYTIYTRPWNVYTVVRIFAALDPSCASRDTSGMKFLLVLLTWFGTITPMTQEIEMRDERKCEAMKERIEAKWVNAPKEFVGIVVCQVK